MFWRNPRNLHLQIGIKHDLHLEPRLNQKGHRRHATGRSQSHTKGPNPAITKSIGTGLVETIHVRVEVALLDGEEPRVVLDQAIGLVEDIEGGLEVILVEYQGIDDLAQTKIDHGIEPGRETKAKAYASSTADHRIHEIHHLILHLTK